MPVFALVLHGGAGALPAERVPAERVEAMRVGLTEALDAGVSVLGRGGSSLDAVVAAVAVLEDCPAFNAGRGAVLRRDGSVRLDASVMSGREQRGGAVCVMRAARNPVRVARAVLERGREVLLAGAEADAFAQEHGLEVCPPEYFLTTHRLEQLARAQGQGVVVLDHDAPGMPGGDEGQTVGAVALDLRGHLSAATSTGGMTNAEPGRVGDSPILGAGTWASDDSCAVSATGSGEHFLRSAFAHEVHCRLRLAGEDLSAATRGALGLVASLGGRGGCVAVDRAGRIASPFTTSAMPRAWSTSAGERRVWVLEPSGG